MFRRRSILFITLCAIVLPAIAVPFVVADEAPLAVNQPLEEAVSSADFKSLMESKKPILILDVRQTEEYEAGHIKDAISIPLGALPDRVGELPRDKEIIVYCRSGKRSAKAVAFLRSIGYTKAVSLDGGYMSCSANAAC